MADVLLSKRTNERTNAHTMLLRATSIENRYFRGERVCDVCVFIVEFISAVIATIWSRHHSVVNRTFDHVERRKERR